VQQFQVYDVVEVKTSGLGTNAFQLELDWYVGQLLYFVDCTVKKGDDIFWTFWKRIFL